MTLHMRYFFWAATRPVVARSDGVRVTSHHLQVINTVRMDKMLVICPHPPPSLVITNEVKRSRKKQHWADIFVDCHAVLQTARKDGGKFLLN
jgi:hypothetical protein